MPLQDLPRYGAHRGKLWIVELVGGMPRADIAAQLVVSPLTVRTHVSRALARLGARDRAQLVVSTYQAGLVVPGT